MPPDRSIRFSLVALSLWTIAPAVAAAAATAAYAWHTGRTAAERELISRAQALAVDMVRELAVPQTALAALATSPFLAAGDFEAFRQQLLLLPKPNGARIVLTDPSGRTRADSCVPTDAAPANPGEAGFVSRVFVARRPQVLDLDAGPLTHKGLVAVEVPVELDGQVAYSLAMAFAPSVFTLALDNRRGPTEDGRAIVVDGNGLIVARSSNVGDFVGRRIGAASRAAVGRGEGIFETTAQDGRPILTANARVPGTGWSTLAATRLDLDDAALRRSIAGAAALGAVVLLLGLLAAEWYARSISAPLHALVGAADALALGRLPRPIPPGVREASRIGAALAWAAAALASRERERASAAAALRENEARFETLTDAMPQMAWAARPDGRHDYYNRRWYEYTGIRPGDGKAWRVLFRSDDLVRAMAAWRHSLATGEPYQAEYRLRRADGAWRWCLSRASPLRDAATGAVQRWFGTCTDIQDLVEARETMARNGSELERLVAERTASLIQAVDALHAEALERLQAEEALRQAQKMESMGQLTGGIAHDFNNMLQGISSSIELVQRRAEQGRMAEANHYIESALKSIDRAAALTSRLLKFTRQQAPQSMPINPDELILGMEDLIRRAVRLSVGVKVQPGGGAWTVLCDPNQLENALLNLAINAGDAMPDGGRLSISTRQVQLGEADTAGHDGARPGDHTEIVVADTGTGMDEATLTRALEPFFTTKPVGKGTGLGLSQLLSFTRLTGGVVRIDSELGHGTTVRLYLPRHEEPHPAVRPAVSA